MYIINNRPPQLVTIRPTHWCRCWFILTFLQYYNFPTKSCPKFNHISLLFRWVTNHAYPVRCQWIPSGWCLSHIAAQLCPWAETTACFSSIDWSRVPLVSPKFIPNTNGTTFRFPDPYAYFITNIGNSEILIRSESTWHYSVKIFYHSPAKECEYCEKGCHRNSEKTEISPNRIRISEIDLALYFG